MRKEGVVIKASAEFIVHSYGEIEKLLRSGNYSDAEGMAFAVVEWYLESRGINLLSVESVQLKLYENMDIEVKRYDDRRD